jgi:hypothetical protein
MSPRHQSILWEAYIERELHVLDEAAMASRTPEHLDSLRWVVPLLSPEERERLLARPRHDMMPEAFDRLLDYCVSLLDAADGARLRSAFCSGRLERGGWPQ